jgi:hypothetical protein
MPCQARFVRAGATSHNAIAAKLNERNVRTARGGVWTHVQDGAILHPFDGASVAAAYVKASPVISPALCPLIEVNRPLLLRCGNRRF